MTLTSTQRKVTYAVLLAANAVLVALVQQKVIQQPLNVHLLQMASLVVAAFMKALGEENQPALEPPPPAPPGGAA